MPEITEEDLRKQRQKVDNLRGKVSESTAVREERERAAAREIEMAQLKAEENRLQSQISLNKEAAKATAVRAGTADLLETVRDEEAVTEAVAVANIDADKAAKE